MPAARRRKVFAALVDGYNMSGSFFKKVRVIREDTRFTALLTPSGQK